MRVCKAVNACRPSIPVWSIIVKQKPISGTMHDIDLVVSSVLATDEKRHFHYRTLLRLALFRMAFGHLYESC